LPIEVYTELGLPLLLDNLEVDVEEAPCIPDSLTVQPGLLLQGIDVPELNAETTRGKGGPSTLALGILRGTISSGTPFALEAKEC
jgi:hypothetical protein